VTKADLAKPFSEVDEIASKQGSVAMAAIKRRGSIMLAFILNAIYRSFIRSSLTGVRYVRG
jgi:hypothetical protein